jgi:hypothetical protein
MDDTILVQDDFLPAEAYESLKRLVSNEPIARWSRFNTEAAPVGYWTRNFTPWETDNLVDVSFVLEETTGLDALHLVWKILREVYLSGSVLVRCCLNGYTCGSHGYFSAESGAGDGHTALLYINDIWEPDWGGETTLLDERNEIVYSVLPKGNRLVLFPTKLRLAGKNISRRCTVLCQTLMFHTRKRRTDSFEKLSVFLRKNGALNHRHLRGTLHDHLVRTFSILDIAGLRQEVCFGGGLHSIYGTSLFPHSIMTEADKPAVTTEFGEYVEHLAYLFSTINRPMTLESPLELDVDAVTVERRNKQMLKLPREIFDDLRKIECANLIDHVKLEEYHVLSEMWSNVGAANRSGAIFAPMRA